MPALTRLGLREFTHDPCRTINKCHVTAVKRLVYLGVAVHMSLAYRPCVDPFLAPSNDPLV